MTVLPDRIETRRLLLREPTDRDLPGLVRDIGNWNVARWLGRVPFPYSAMHGRQWLVRWHHLRASRRDFVLAIALRSRPDRMIGAIGWHHIDRTRPDLGYWLAEPHWGRGYVSEAAVAMLHVLFALKPEATPASSAMPDNRGSVRVLEKAGFRRFGPRHHMFNLARRRKVPVVRFEWKGCNVR